MMNLGYIWHQIKMQSVFHCKKAMKMKWMLYIKYLHIERKKCTMVGNLYDFGEPCIYISLSLHVRICVLCIYF